MRSILRQINDKLIEAEKITCALLLFAVLMVTVWGVFERFVLQIGFGWSDEVARYVNVYCIFLGACLGVVKSAHVGVDVFVRLVPARYHKILGAIAYVLCAAFCASVAVTGYSYFLRLQASNQISAALQIPICWVFFAVPLGCGLMCLHYILRLALGDIETPVEVPSKTVKGASDE
ncbi:putative TRAP dicarboxylate transporter, DctQ subunit [uncultured delta proteobacterium]|uniref:Putative TRAP dicarboxylate transporter, DctQ subunit n=1 Tax=uncultured delta proteobacterium TaxID=34034 RepID=A0A212K772_9DELT|nr:putative TRAP dicarboxylate transporter, DctQ subunit [uncultured delta proteobacterium]